MATVPAEVSGPSDAELIDKVRSGTISAYGALYERHVSAAYNLARQLSRSSAEADDLVSEAFAKVLDTLRAGRGPDSAFRAYLLTALRHTAYDKTRRDRRLELAEDVTSAAGVKATDVSVPFADPAVAGLERSLAARAFAKLPERWQAVLWHTEIEGQSPAEVAPILGLTPNGVSALAYRAREGLRQAYLQVHLAETTEQRCRATADRLGAWTRSGLSKRERAQVESHLDDCDRCRALAAELADVNGAMRARVAPLVLGAGAVGYLALAGSAKASAATGAVVAAGAGGGAAGAVAGGPRQFVGVAASSVALAAAVALGLTASSGDQQIPPAAAEQQTEQPPPPPGESPDQQQPDQQRPPDSEPAPDEPTTEPTTSEPTTPPDEPSPTPQPDGPSLSASGPSTPVSLVAGDESPTVLPITVSNTGDQTSEPVSATLSLPPGVRAVQGGSRYGPEPMLRLNAAAPAVVNCPAGTGTVRCSTKQGLAPGETTTLRFRLVADESSEGGQITGSVSAGSSVRVRITVQVKVNQPRLQDGVEVRAHAGWLDTLLPGLRHRKSMHAVATNTGESTKPVTIIVDHAADAVRSSHELDCSIRADVTRCTTSAAVSPDEHVYVNFLLEPEPVRVCDHQTVEVSAILGSATSRTIVDLRCLGPLIGPLEGTR